MDASSVIYEVVCSNVVPGFSWKNQTEMCGIRREVGLLISIVHEWLNWLIAVIWMLSDALS